MEYRPPREGHCCRCRGLVRDGEGEEARALLTKTLDRFGTGSFDGRGFASGGAYKALAEAACQLGDIGLANELLAKALAVAKRDRAIILDGIVSTYAKMGAYDEALAAARLVRGRRAELESEVLFRAKRWKELAATLAPVKTPGQAARVAWGLTRLALGHED